MARGWTWPATRSRTRRGRLTLGEAGTNGQHSFYQLVHQGRIVPAEFIGVLKSQADVFLSEEASSSHEELLCNFFAQPDALALGTTADRPPPEFPGQQTVPVHAAAGAERLHGWPAAGAVRAPGRRERVHLGHQLVRPMGASSSARCWPDRSAPSWSGAALRAARSASRSTTARGRCSGPVPRGQQRAWSGSEFPKGRLD